MTPDKGCAVQPLRRNTMLITQTTTWEGTPAAIEAVVAGSREAAPIHEGLGAKNPRLMRSVSGGDVHQVEYMIDFDSFEAVTLHPSCILHPMHHTQSTRYTYCTRTLSPKARNLAISRFVVYLLHRNTAVGGRSWF